MGPQSVPVPTARLGKSRVIFRDLGEHGLAVEPVRDFTKNGIPVWGIHARNREQNFALNLLMDPELDFVSLLGTAGTGKTLLALAAGLAQTLEDKTVSGDSHDPRHRSGG